MFVRNSFVDLHLGDCLDVMPKMPDNSVDLILCDLPYGTTQNKWDSVIAFEPLWSHYKRVCKGVIVLTANQPFTSALVASNFKDFRYSLVWKKSRPTGHMNAKRQPLREHEDVLVFYEAQPIYNPQFTEGKPNHVNSTPRVRSHSGNHGKQYATVDEVTTRKYPRSVLKFDSLSQTQIVHPTQKPVPLMEYLIRTYSNEGDTVLDNCMGSGTTGVAAVNTGRNFIGIERDPGYCQTALWRIVSLNQSRIAA